MPRQHHPGSRRFARSAGFPTSGRRRGKWGKRSRFWRKGKNAARAGNVIYWAFAARSADSRCARCEGCKA